MKKMNLNSSIVMAAFMLEGGRAVGVQTRSACCPKLATFPRHYCKPSRLSEHAPDASKTWAARTEATHMRPSSLSWYFWYSSSHCAWLSGGSDPLTGRHSVMLRPDSVSRVRPPTTTMLKVRNEVQ